MTRVMCKTLMALSVVVAGAAAPAAAEDMRFDLVLRGFTAGSLTISGDADSKSYTVSGVLKTTGLAALIKRVSYSAKATGQVSGEALVPSAYAEHADTGKRVSDSSITYKGGVPVVSDSKTEREPKPWDISAASQKGTVDPLTALFATLRDVEPGQECKIGLKMFDGRRASQIGTAAPKSQSKTVVCAGEYRRLAGFSPEDMAEKTRFPFSLTYAPVEGGKMRVVEVAMDSLYGKARLTRR